jgi:hypothetical protein
VPECTLRPLGILSPTHDDAGNFSLQQSLSFDSSDSMQLVLSDNADWRLEVAPAEFLTYVEKVNLRLSCFKSTLARPFRDIKASYCLLVTDLKTIHYNVAVLH